MEEKMHRNDVSCASSPEKEIVLRGNMGFAFLGVMLTDLTTGALFGILCLFSESIRAKAAIGIVPILLFSLLLLPFFIRQERKKDLALGREGVLVLAIGRFVSWEDVEDIYYIHYADDTVVTGVARFSPPYAERRHRPMPTGIVGLPYLFTHTMLKQLEPRYIVYIKVKNEKKKDYTQSPAVLLSEAEKALEFYEDFCERRDRARDDAQKEQERAYTAQIAASRAMHAAMDARLRAEAQETAAQDKKPADDSTTDGIPK